MQLVNKTKWETSSLKDLFKRAASILRKTEGAPKRKLAKVTITTDHRLKRPCSIRTVLHERPSSIVKLKPGVDSVRVLRSFTYLLAKQTYLLDATAAYRLAYDNALGAVEELAVAPVPEKPPKKSLLVTRQDRTTAALHRAQDKLSRSTKQTSRLQTKVRALEKLVAYYEKKKLLVKSVSSKKLSKEAFAERMRERRGETDKPPEELIVNVEFQ